MKTRNAFSPACNLGLNQFVVLNINKGAILLLQFRHIHSNISCSRSKGNRNTSISRSTTSMVGTSLLYDSNIKKYYVSPSVTHFIGNVPFIPLCKRVTSGFPSAHLVFGASQSGGGPERQHQKIWISTIVSP